MKKKLLFLSVISLLSLSACSNTNTDETSSTQTDEATSTTTEMVVSASEITENEMLEAIFFGHQEIQRLVSFQEEIIDHIQPEKKAFIPVYFIVVFLLFLLFKFYIQTDNFSIYILIFIIASFGIASVIYNSRNKYWK